VSESEAIAAAAPATAAAFLPAAAATTEPAATATEPAATATEPAATATRALLRLVHADLPAVEFGSVQLGDGGRCRLWIRHRDERESARLPARAIDGDCDFPHLTRGGEGGFERFLSGVERQVSYKKTASHDDLSDSIARSVCGTISEPPKGPSKTSPPAGADPSNANGSKPSRPVSGMQFAFSSGGFFASR
jgi:hypothetical protein